METYNVHWRTENGERFSRKVQAVKPDEARKKILDKEGPVVIEKVKKC